MKQSRGRVARLRPGAPAGSVERDGNRFRGRVGKETTAGAAEWLLVFAGDRFLTAHRLSLPRARFELEVSQTRLDALDSDLRFVAVAGDEAWSIAWKPGAL